MTNQDNVYKGERRKIKRVILNFVIPDGLSDDDIEAFLDSVYLTIRKNHISYKHGTKQKTIAARDTIINGWNRIK